MDPKNPLSQKQAPEEATPLPPESNPVESEKPMPRSRANRAMENKAKRNIVLTILGMILIFALLGTFGVTALQKLSEYTVKEKDEADTSKSTTTFIAPPSLDSPFDATGSAEIILSGHADDGKSVKLYVNGAFSDSVDIEDDRSFTFEDVVLKEGSNSLKAKVIKDNKESNFSDEIKIVYFSKAPTLEVTSPADGRSFNGDQNPIEVAGKTDPKVTVTVNDYRAIMHSDGSFEYRLTLHSGDNDIKIVATDTAGNKTEKQVKAILQ